MGSGGCEWVHVYSDCVGKCLYVSARGECVLWKDGSEER